MRRFCTYTIEGLFRYAREHERSVHGTGDSYQCNICGERLKLAIYAVKHVQKEHPNCTEKPFGQYYKVLLELFSF